MSQFCSLSLFWNIENCVHRQHEPSWYYEWEKTRKKNTEQVSSIQCRVRRRCFFRFTLSCMCVGSIWLSCEQRNNSMSSFRYIQQHNSGMGLSKLRCFLCFASFLVSRWNNANFRFQLFDFKSLQENVSFFCYRYYHRFRSAGPKNGVHVLCLYSARRYEILLDKFGPAFLKRLRLQPKCPIIIKKNPIN